MFFTHFRTEKEHSLLQSVTAMLNTIPTQSPCWETCFAGPFIRSIGEETWNIVISFWTHSHLHFSSLCFHFSNNTWSLLDKSTTYLSKGSTIRLALAVPLLSLTRKQVDSKFGPITLCRLYLLIPFIPAPVYKDLKRFNGVQQLSFQHTWQFTVQWWGSGSIALSFVLTDTWRS